MKPSPEYLSIPKLAKCLGMSEEQARWLAKSKRLRSVKGAVINVNMGKGKYEILKVNIHDAIRAFEASM